MVQRKDVRYIGYGSSNQRVIRIASFIDLVIVMSKLNSLLQIASLVFSCSSQSMGADEPVTGSLQIVRLGDQSSHPGLTMAEPDT